jgi:hypothetical protein
LSKQKDAALKINTKAFFWHKKMGIQDAHFFRPSTLAQALTAAVTTTSIR